MSINGTTTCYNNYYVPTIHKKHTINLPHTCPNLNGIKELTVGHGDLVDRLGSFLIEENENRLKRTRTIFFEENENYDWNEASCTLSNCRMPARDWMLCDQPVNATR